MADSIDASKVTWDNSQTSANTQINPSEVQWDNSTAQETSQEPNLFSTVQDKLNVGDNLKMSFADESGRLNILREKYNYAVPTQSGEILVGDNPTDVQPYKPNPVFRDPMGFIARHVSDINQVAQSIALEGAGVALAPATGGASLVIPALLSGAGLASGGITNKLIGKSLGINEAKNIAEDAAIDTAFGSGFYGASKILPRGFQAAKEKAFNLINKSIIAEPDPAKRSAFVNGVSKVMGITSGVPSEKIAYLIENPELAAKTMGTAEHLSKITDDITNQFNSIEQPVKQQVRGEYFKLKNLFKNGIPTANKDNAGIQGDFINVLKDMGVLSVGAPESGWIVNEVALKKNPIANDILEKFNEISNGSIKKFRDTNTKQLYRSLEINPEARVNPERLDFIQKEFHDKASSMYLKGESKTARPYGLLSNGGEVDVIGGQQAADGAINRRSIGGINSFVKDMADQSGQKSFGESIAKLASVKKAKDALSFAGLELSNPLKMESAIKSLVESSPKRLESVIVADSMLGTKFAKMIKDYDVASSFQSEKVNLFRIGTIMGLIGMGSLREASGPAKLPYIGLALGLASPKGVAGIVRGSESLKTAGSKLPLKSGINTLRTLLAQQSSKSNKETSKKLSLR